MQTAKSIRTAVSHPLTSNVDKTLLVKIDSYGHVPVYASVSAFIVAGLYKPLLLRHTIMRAVNAFWHRCSGDTASQKLRVLEGNRDYDRLWAIQDDESIVLMFPEDF